MVKSRSRSRSCPRGAIRRKSFSQHRGKSTIHYPSTCIKDRGLPGHGKKLFTLKKGELGKYGYHLNDPASNRFNALMRGVSDAGFATINRRLVALRLLNRNTNPSLAHKVDNDIISLHRALHKPLPKN